MPTPICNVLSMTGIRRTSSSESYNVLVEAYHPIALGDIDRVDFAISSNGGASSTTSVTSRASWKPDDSTYDDPLPGSWGGGPSYIWCYGIKIQMADYAAGYIDVIPTVYGGNGESKTLSTVRIYNDKDGTDRRPSPKIIYWDYINGNDSNSGLSSGLAKKSFEKAAEAAATSSDCGGAIIYVDSAGDHQVRGSNYGQNGNLYTSGHHWLQVLPRAGLAREDVKIVRIPAAEDFDFRWMYFKGTTTTPGLQQARIRFSNLTIVNSGFKIGTWTHLYMSLWIDHCLNGPPAPYITPVLGTGVHIRSLETVAGCIDLVNKKDGIDKIFITGSTRRCTFGGGQWGDIVRGCLIDKFAGQVFQPQYKDSVLTNILVKDIFQEVGVSGRFVATGSFRIESRGGSNYRIQANPGYAGRDFIPDLQYISGSPRLGLRLENFTNSSNNNMAIDLLSGGYSGSLPWVDVSTARSANALTPESDANAIVTNGDFNNPTTDYNTWGPHSDIFQFVETEGYPVSNIIISNFAVFPAYETQGIFKYDDTRLSGIAFINYYDGGIGEGPRSYYWFGTPPTAKNILYRNSYVSRLEVSSTDDIDNSEIIDSVMGLISAQEGTLTGYTGRVDVRYNHWTGTQTVGGNSSNGLYFANANPSIVLNATVSPSSTAFGTASTTWPRPTAWFSGHKGPWGNVALADWSYTESTGSSGVGVNAGITFSASSIPTPGLSVIPGHTTLAVTGTIPNFTTQLTSSVLALTSSGQIPAQRAEVNVSIQEVTKTIVNTYDQTYNITVSSPTAVLSGVALGPITEGGMFMVFPEATTSSGVIPQTTQALTVAAEVLPNTGTIPSIYNETIIHAGITSIGFTVQETESVSTFIAIDDDGSGIVQFSFIDPTISLTPPVIVIVSSPTSITFSSIDPTVVTTIVPVVQPPAISIEVPSFTFAQDLGAVTLEQTSTVIDTQVLPILIEMSQVKNDLNRLPQDTKAVWSQTILEAPTTQTSRAVVNILTNNYHKFTKVGNNSGSRSVTNRKRF